MYLFVKISRKSILNSRLRDATKQSDRMTKAHKLVADCYIKISSSMTTLATSESTKLET